MSRFTTISVLVFTVFITSCLQAQMPPSPVEVANTVSNLWMKRDFTGMSFFVTNIYMTHSNYVPAIMAASFHDSYFNGDYAISHKKLLRVRDGATNWPSGYAHDFLDVLGGQIKRSEDSLRFFLKLGMSEDDHRRRANPNIIRNYYGDDKLPLPIYYLFWAPNTNVWHESN